MSNTTRRQVINRLTADHIGWKVGDIVQQFGDGDLVDAGTFLVTDVFNLNNEDGYMALVTQLL